MTHPESLRRFRLYEGSGADALRAPARRADVLITGGAGFVGTNLAARLLESGRRVRIVDNLARPGVERNLRWLRDRYDSQLDVAVADVRDESVLAHAVRGVKHVVHLAAQVAVTTSVVDPLADFGVNLAGTVRLIDALRRLDDPPTLLFTSTNKVYGALPELELERNADRWEPADDRLRERGLDERAPLDFCTPYGCSKGGADQYVLDAAKTYGLSTTVFRMSCIYGPHQHGNEDQGWVAHFLIRALAGKPITIYGDGAQVRDILFVSDLVRAMLRTFDLGDELAGQAFVIGGGKRNALSLLETVAAISELVGEEVPVEFAPTRIGDQRWYVADTEKFELATGWEPRVEARDGIARLHEWLAQRPTRVATGSR